MLLPESNQMLGSGCYGKVTLAKMKANGNTMLAAVKYVNGGYTNQIVSFRSILMEIKVLMHIGSHENIVQFLGANTKGINQGSCNNTVELFRYYSLDKHDFKMPKHV